MKLLLENYIFHLSLKSHHYFWLLFKEKLSQRPFKNSPIWSHWTGTYTAILILSYHKSRKITATFWGKKWVFTWKLELHAVWPDLAKFRHFCNILKVLFGIRQIFEPDLANLYAIRKIYIVTKGQILKIIIEGSGHIDC